LKYPKSQYLLLHSWYRWKYLDERGRANMPPQNCKPVHGEALSQNVYIKRNRTKNPQKRKFIKKKVPFIQNMNNLIEHHKNFTDSRGMGIYL